MNDFQDIQDFVKEFSKIISENSNKYKGLKYVSETYLYSPKGVKIIDGALTKNDEIVAVFEFISKHKQINEINIWESMININLSFRYMIISNGKEFKILDTFSKTTFNATTIFELLDRILLLPTKVEISKLLIEVANIINNCANEYFQDNRKILNYLSKKKIEKQILFNEDGQYFCFSEDLKDLSNFENKLFQFFLEEIKPDEEIYRYTTLDTVFATIKNKSIRLNGLVGMNDISEVGYVDNYLDSKNYQPYWHDETPHQRISAINRRYILCCSSLKDDLNQWRLYGDDCQGVCLTFKVKRGINISGVQLRKVSYGILKDGKNYHHELDFIKETIDRIQDQLSYSFKFKTLEIWKHFFKSYEYSPEKEIRLLIIVSTKYAIKGEELHTVSPDPLKTDWNLTSTHRILNPFITINLNDKVLPIRLKEIRLGTKTPEKYINKKQFEELLRYEKINYSGHHAVDVVLSEIKNYR